MQLAKSFFIASAFALAFGGAYAADDKQAKADAEPGFNNLDANHDGKLTRSEAGKDKSLVANWKDADRDGNGSLTRAEYLRVKGKKDMNWATEKVQNAVSDDKSSSAGGTSKPK
jgi:hypothetical protein